MTFAATVLHNPVHPGPWPAEAQQYTVHGTSTQNRHRQTPHWLEVNHFTSSVNVVYVSTSAVANTEVCFT